jgi:hypothetical protein
MSSEHPTAALALTFRVACSEHSTAVLAVAFRAARGRRVAPGRSEGRGPTRDGRGSRRDAAATVTALASAPIAVCSDRVGEDAVAALASVLRDDRLAKTAGAIGACAVAEVRDDRVAKRAGAIVACTRDREIRVLAAPLDPAGRIRGDVIEDRQVDLLGDRARSPHAATRMAFRVACSEHSTAALAS